MVVRKPPKKPMALGNIMKIAVICWSASMLTAYYAKLLPQMDATFMAGLLTSTLGSMGIDVMRREPDAQPPTPPRKPPTTS